MLVRIVWKWKPLVECLTMDNHEDKIAVYDTLSKTNTEDQVTVASIISD